MIRSPISSAIRSAWRPVLGPAIGLLQPTFRIRPDSIPAGGTFSRGTSATQVNADGSLTLVPAGVLRTADYSDDPARAGIKIEGQATNLFRDSGDFLKTAGGGGGFWLWSILTAVNSSAAGRMGVNTITNTGTNTDSWIGQDIAFAGQHTVSVVVIAAGSTAARIRVRPIVFGSSVLDCFADFSVSAGNFIFGGLPTGATNSSTQLAPGVFKFSVSIPAQPGQTTIQPRIMVVNDQGQTVAGESLQIAEVQVEAGPVATSYIPTAGAAVTRGADVLTYPVGAIAGWNSSAGSFTSSIRCGPISARNGGILSVALASGNADLYFNFGKQRLYNGVDTTDLQPVSDADVVNGIKSAIAYAAAGGLQAIKGGVSGATLSPLIAGRQPASVSIGSVLGSSLGGSLYALDYYPVALPATRLQALTAP